MPRVTHVKKSRKETKDSYTGNIIPIGSAYYWWAFRFGPKCCSIKYPKPSQLTRSAFYIGLYNIQESLALQAADDTFKDYVESDLTSELESLKDETQESLDNMPESLTYSPTGELLQERIDALESYIGELESLDLEEFDKDTIEEGEDLKEAEVDHYQAQKEEVEALSCDV